MSAEKGPPAPRDLVIVGDLVSSHKPAANDERRSEVT